MWVRVEEDDRMKTIYLDVAAKAGSLENYIHMPRELYDEWRGAQDALERVESKIRLFVADQDGVIH
jgi:hypothetical protein